MERKKIFGLIIILIAGLISCKRSDTGSSGSLAGSLQTSVAEILGTDISATTAATEHAAAVESYCGDSSAYVISGTGDIDHFRIPGWSFTTANHMKFSIPHIDSCVTVSVSSSSYPKEIVIEFIKGCSNHRHDRSGKIIIDLSDTITNAGAVQTVRYENFYIDTISVDLEATIKNLGKNSSGNWLIEKTYDQTITSGEDVAVRKNTETQEWITGFETAVRSDNKYYLSGSGTIVLNDTVRFSKLITTPLLFDASCDYISSGVIELTRGGVTSTIDYGDGTCDDVATVATGGTTEEINLQSVKFRHGGNFSANCPGFGHKKPGGH